ncbi:2OG-Fe(II) oxygenase [Sphingomonas humi]|uniref:Fe2OG dioxygenase domain-containing protein n=1 Tax=Sphingomonas humi TaxID=335630 RepID=A0ABP7SC47_9SPHN
MIDEAYALAERGSADEAVRLLERSGQDGEAAAWLELGAWFLSGQIIRRDLSRARECFRLAGDGGDAQGATLYRNFLGIGVGGDRDWPGAVALLRRAAGTDRDAAAQLALLEAMALDPEGDPSTTFAPRELSAAPHVASFEGFLTAAECDYLVNLALPIMQPSVVVDPRSGAMRPDPVRTSHAAMLAWADENPLVHALNRRIAAASGTAVTAGEPLQLLRYTPGQEYRPHFDALPNVTNQRVLTMLVYLNEDYEGGATSFPKSGLSYRGKTGDALLFRNALGDGRPDPASLHAGAPVTRGTKYLASRWIHQREFMPMR